MEVFRLFIKERIKYHFPILQDVQRRRIFEGEGTTMIREDGAIDETLMRKIEAKFDLKFSEIPALSLPEILKKLDDVAQEMAVQQAKQFYETIKECVQQSGRTKDAGGTPFSKEMYLDLLRSVSINFDSYGNPRLPQLSVSKEIYQQVKNILDEASLDPIYVKAYQEVISDKREEFRVREGSRKLVG